MSTETSHQTTTVLANLDFAVSCCCDAVCCPHGHTTECGDPASLIVTLHLVNACNRDHCDPDGNTIGPMCQTCLNRFSTQLRHEIDALPKGFVYACATCFAPIKAISDVIREIRPL